MNDILHRLNCASYRWYAFFEGTNFYHNQQHAADVVSMLYLMQDTQPSRELVLAAQWHDAVYIPGCDSGVNEECSAAALINESHAFKGTFIYDIVEKAAELIRFTSIEYHLHDRRLRGDIATLLDSDISSLASRYDIFVKNQDNIIRENHGDVTTDRVKCAQFLENFLTSREFIFHTDNGRRLYENYARENIKKYLIEHS